MYLLHGGKSGKTILKHVQPERVEAAHIHVYTQIKLAVIDQVGSSQVPEIYQAQIILEVHEQFQ